MTFVQLISVVGQRRFAAAALGGVRVALSSAATARSMDVFAGQRRRVARQSKTLPVATRRWENVLTAGLAAFALAGLVGGIVACVRSRLAYWRRLEVAALRDRYFDQRSREAAEPRGERSPASQRRAIRKQEVRARLHATATAASDADLHDPRRYVPPAPAGASARSLDVREGVQLRDGRGEWAEAAALLDTGNEHLTVIDAGFAARIGLLGAPGGSVFARPVRTTTLRGIVPGAEHRDVPVIHAELRIRGHVLLIEAAVCEMRQQEVLVGLQVLREMFARGYTIS